MRARLVASVIALILALALSSMPMAYADIPASAKPCHTKIFAENNKKYGSSDTSVGALLI
jgi:hypothetical protein